jgi:hypothetical protein
MRDRVREPHPNRLPPEHPRREAILAAHDRALDAGEATYVDPASGFQVFTAAFLLQRGTCCDTGCRHCPFVD